jgi:hypothetical protein
LEQDDRADEQQAGDLAQGADHEQRLAASLQAAEEVGAAPRE